MSSPHDKDLSILNRRKEILRVILSVSIIVVGITHFVKPEQYARIVPPQLPILLSWYILVASLKFWVALAY